MIGKRLKKQLERLSADAEEGLSIFSGDDGWRESNEVRNLLLFEILKELKKISAGKRGKTK